MDRVRTYIENLDEILQGGFPRNSLISIVGEPGVGKTVLALQIMANNAAQGLKCLYLTTLSEPANKIIDYVEDFQFFRKELVEDRFIFRDIGTTLRSGGPTQAGEEIVRLVEELRPDIVAIDSFRAMRDLAKNAEEARGFIYELAVHLSVWSVTTFLVSVYDEQESGRNPEFTISDGMIHLSYKLDGLQAVRQFQVRKMRRSGFNGGLHFHDIDSDGIHVFPRLGSIVEKPPVESKAKVTSGIAELDQMLDGGLPRNSTTLIEGATGVGKTILSLNFMAEGVRQGEKTLFFATEEGPDQIRAVAENIGLAGLTEDGMHIEYADPVDLLPARWLDRARTLIEETGAKRIVIDGLSSIRAASLGDRPFRDLVYSSMKMFRSLGVTAIMTMESTKLLTTDLLSGVGVSWSADNIIVMHYVDTESELRRVIGIVKARGTSHETSLREFTITKEGMKIREPLEKRHGLFTGTSKPSE